MSRPLGLATALCDEPSEALRASPRPPHGVALVAGQVWYQLKLLRRSPLGAFITLVIPLMLLVALDLVTPEMTLESLGHRPVVQFLAPAMAAFAVINAGFVDTVVGVTLARESGVLKRLDGTPLPRWAYFAGRLGSAGIVAACSVALVVGAGVVFFHAHLGETAVGLFAGAAAAGFVASFAVGTAVSTLVSSADAALPIAYALLLPVAFISGVFFPAPGEARWLHDLAAALPAQPIASSMEAAFTSASQPISPHNLIVLGLWTLAACALVARRFSWQPTGGRSTP